MIKPCTRCGIEKALEEFYRKDSAGDGRRSECKDCIKAMNRAWEAQHKERRRELNVAFREANPDYFHDYYRANTELHIERCRRWAANNPDKNRDARLRYREANRDMMNAKRREWRANHRLQVCLENHERRAKLRGIFVERVELEVVWQRDEGLCGICGLEADPRQWDLDHIIPVSHAGCLCGSHPPPTHSYINTRVFTPVV